MLFRPAAVQIAELTAFKAYYPLQLNNCQHEETIILRREIVVVSGSTSIFSNFRKIIPILIYISSCFNLNIFAHTPVPVPNRTTAKHEESVVFYFLDNATFANTWFTAYCNTSDLGLDK